MSRYNPVFTSELLLITTFASRGQACGKMIKIADGSLDAYVAEASSGDKAHAGVAILLIPDIFGFANSSKLIADQFAANGYTTLIPDIFNGDVFAPDTDPVNFIFNGSDGSTPHTPEAVDPIISAGIKALKEQYGASKVGGVGYCLGAKYVVRHYKKGIEVGFVAHPSFVEGEELANITGPLSIAAAESDAIFPTEKRHESETILEGTTQPYQITLYSGVEHGFACRGDTSSKVGKFAKEAAFLQAVNWFDTWLL
jgi:dienelactone hydrolase